MAAQADHAGRLFALDERPMSRSARCVDPAATARPEHLPRRRGIFSGPTGRRTTINGLLDQPRRRLDRVGAEQARIAARDEGYRSSPVAATLEHLGFSRATDLEGGFVAWRAAGLPVEPVR